MVGRFTLLITSQSELLLLLANEHYWTFILAAVDIFTHMLLANQSYWMSILVTIGRITFVLLTNQRKLSNNLANENNNVLYI